MQRSCIPPLDADLQKGPARGYAERTTHFSCASPWSWVERVASEARRRRVGWDREPLGLYASATRLYVHQALIYFRMPTERRERKVPASTG
jgi:hypothetical protein